MNMIDKVNDVQKGLECCAQLFQCSDCPYDKRDMCRYALVGEAHEVICALREELKKMTKTEEAKPKFITLTTGNVQKDEGDDWPRWYDSCKVAVKTDDILMICDAKAICGSEIRFKTAKHTVVRVQESIADILDMIAKGD